MLTAVERVPGLFIKNLTIFFLLPRLEKDENLTFTHIV